MARKTNYAFERNSRAKAKAAKREAKQQAKLAARAEKANSRSDGENPDALPAQAPEAENNESTRDDGATPRDSS